MQDDSTLNPQVIDGCIPKWCVKSELVKIDHNLRQFFEDKWNWLQQREKSNNVIGFYLYDVQPVNGIIDENKNLTGQGALIVRFDYIKNNQ